MVWWVILCVAVVRFVMGFSVMDLIDLVSLSINRLTKIPYELCMLPLCFGSRALGASDCKTDSHQRIKALFLILWWVDLRATAVAIMSDLIAEKQRCQTASHEPELLQRSTSAANTKQDHEMTFDATSEIRSFMVAGAGIPIRCCDPSSMPLPDAGGPGESDSSSDVEREICMLGQETPLRSARRRRVETDDDDLDGDDGHSSMEARLALLEQLLRNSEQRRGQAEDFILKLSAEVQ
eukprot:TRINITY_DN21644_c0_g1_i1.p1 TRINITY_DN21644_c0_g1~~TRINITY_DN21644_c0_g1_i1.p1  ORF type:complete len:237 (+),score=37.79 TRINITY_DN21644_c0_g1_i1:1779-2489(+)